MITPMKRLLIVAVTFCLLPLFGGAALAGTFYPYGDGYYNQGIYQGCDGSNCTITLATSGTVSLPVTPTPSGVCTVQSDSVLVETNDPDGYGVTVTTSTTNTNMVSGGNNIAASAGTDGTPAALMMGKWGYRIDSVSGFGSGPTSQQTNGSVPAVYFAGVPASNGTPDAVATSNTTALSGDTTYVWYGVCADFSVVAASYSVSVTYTATAN